MPFEKTDKIWMDGEFVDWDAAQVHVLTHALHYGSGVFEGIRAYPTARGVAVFRLTDHIDRLFRSAEMLLMDVPYTRAEIVDACKQAVTINRMDDGCYLRPIFFLSYGEIGLNTMPCKTSASIAVWPWGAYLGEEGLRLGVRMKVSSWRRQDPAAVPTAAKAAGFYVNSSLAKVEALKAGYDEAIMLNTQGYVAECSGENIFLVRHGRILTPPTSAGILEGITRDSVIAIARDLGHEVVETPILRNDLYLADEIFCTGTAAEVVGIREVDDRRIGAGEPGPVTRRIQETYSSVVRGEVDQYKDWVEHVRA
jgi:branched-chain amino acid aminotransferase